MSLEHTPSGATLTLAPSGAATRRTLSPSGNGRPGGSASGTGPRVEAQVGDTTYTYTWAAEPGTPAPDTPGTPTGPEAAVPGAVGWLEQTWQVPARPAEDRLVVDVRVRRAALVASGDGGYAALGPRGATRFRLPRPTAVDAAGQAGAASLVVRGHSAVVSLDPGFLARAVYPVRVRWPVGYGDTALSGAMPGGEGPDGLQVAASLPAGALPAGVPSAGVPLGRTRRLRRGPGGPTRAANWGAPRAACAARTRRPAAHAGAHRRAAAGGPCRFAAEKAPELCGRDAPGCSRPNCTTLMHHAHS